MNVAAAKNHAKRRHVPVRTLLASSLLFGGALTGTVFGDATPASAQPAVINTFNTGINPTGVSSDGTHVWVANYNDDTVTELNASTGALVNTIPVGSGPVAVSSDGTHVWVANATDDSVTELDASTGAVANTIAVGGTPNGISSDGNHVWVANSSGNTVTELDASTGAVVNTISVGNSPYGISSDGTHVWVTNFNDNTVSELNATTGGVVSTIPVPGDNPNGVSSDGTHVWVADQSSNQVIELDASTGAVVNTTAVGGHPIGISSDGTNAWVTNNGGNSTVNEVDALTGSVVNTVTVGLNPYGISSEGNHVWVTNQSDNTVSEIATPTIDGVTFGGNPNSPTITVSGSGFGTLGDIGTPNAASATQNCSPATGDDYGSNFYIWDQTDPHYFVAGLGPPNLAAVGVSITSYSNNRIVFTLGSCYAQNGWTFSPGDKYTMNVLGSTFTGTASPGTGYTCTVSGVSGTTSFPLVVGESPAPPASIDEGGTFSTAPSVQVTVPASVIDSFIGHGATSLTIASQTTDLDGRSSVGGALSGAVSPNTESASASNLPLSDILVADTPYTYDTTYDPVTWQTGTGTGKVYFTPGNIDAEVTLVIHGTPTSESISCVPPSGVAALGSTTVNPPTPTPSFQVPASTPPLQNQVTPGTDGGWGATISNTSTATVKGLTATVSVADGGNPLSYDLASMAASGTNCSSAGSDKVTCAVGNLVDGGSSTLDVLIDTLACQGVDITGSVAVNSSNAGAKSTTLGKIEVVVVTNGTDAVAAPGIPLVSSKEPLSKAKAKVTLTLPKQKKRRTNSVAIADGLLAFPLTGTRPVNSPVPVKLRSLAPSAEPALSPDREPQVRGEHPVQAFGNFSGYTNNDDPIVAVVQIHYGLKIPAGSLYFLKPNGTTVDKLSLCRDRERL